MKNKPTPRQLEFLSLIASGLDTQGVAKVSDVSHNTVRNTIVAAKEKTGASSTANLIAYCVAQGWIWPVDDGIPANFAVITQ
jgi:DNA-binding NarL/FixJ family response regulator